MPHIWTKTEDYKPDAVSDKASEDDESDTTPNWIPLILLFIWVPIMLGIFILIGYLVL